MREAHHARLARGSRAKRQHAGGVSHTSAALASTFRISLAMAATVALPVPTIRATRLMPKPAASAARTCRGADGSSWRRFPLRSGTGAGFRPPGKVGKLPALGQHRNLA
jgi:hypothetical protein